MSTPRSGRGPGQILPDKHDLYELCVQNPARDAAMLRAIHAGAVKKPPARVTLGEDFCATAALSRAWCAQGDGFDAVAVDHDAAVLKRARAHGRVRLVRADVRRVRDAVDVVGVLNFSICELHERGELVKYFKHVRTRLKTRGVVVCDIYGGSDAFATGVIRQKVKLPVPRPVWASGVKTVHYEWEQRLADPLTGRVENAMHFDVTPVHGTVKGGRVLRMEDAFVYRWRLWSVPELREAMVEAGFKATAVYPRIPAAEDGTGRLYIEPIVDPVEVGDSFNVYVVGRR